MRNDVLELLSLFHRKETISQAVLAFFLVTLLRLEVCIDTHKACDSSDVLVFKCFNELEDALGGWLGPNIQQYADLGIELPAKAFEKP